MFCQEIVNCAREGATGLRRCLWIRAVLLCGDHFTFELSPVGLDHLKFDVVNKVLDEVDHSAAKAKSFSHILERAHLLHELMVRPQVHKLSLNVLGKEDLTE